MDLLLWWVRSGFKLFIFRLNWTEYLNWTDFSSRFLFSFHGFSYYSYKSFVQSYVLEAYQLLKLMSVIIILSLFAIKITHPSALITCQYRIDRSACVCPEKIHICKVKFKITTIETEQRKIYVFWWVMIIVLHTTAICSRAISADIRCRSANRWHYK